MKADSSGQSKVFFEVLDVLYVFGVLKVLGILEVLGVSEGTKSLGGSGDFKVGEFLTFCWFLVL